MEYCQARSPAPHLMRPDKKQAGAANHWINQYVPITATKRSEENDSKMDNPQTALNAVLPMQQRKCLDGILSPSRWAHGHLLFLSNKHHAW